MTILVTGGAGYIGSHTNLELLTKDYDVIVVDNYMNSKPESIARVEALTGKKIKVYEVDLLDRENLRSVFQENEIDAVIHFAGLKAVGESVAIPLKYYHNNITGTLVLCELMAEFGVYNMVFSSSATVYGMNNISPLVETLPLSTTNPYGTTKLMIEQILGDLQKTDERWSIAVLRYFNPIGAHESGRIGEDPNGIPNNLMPYITQTAVGKRSELGVFGDDYDTPDGTGVRDYIHVVDLAVGHVSAVEYVQGNTGIEAINLGTGNGYSVLDVVNTFVEATGAQVPYKVLDRRPGDIATCYADATKAEQLLGFKTTKTLSDMCRDAWKWQSDNPRGYE